MSQVDKTIQFLCIIYKSIIYKMRIHIKTTKNNVIIPFNYQHKLVGALHKWLGINDLHGTMAMYSFSWLMNAIPNEKGLEYPNGANFFISFYDQDLCKRVIGSILNDPDICYGLRVIDITIEEDPDLSNKNLFNCASPVFIRRYNNEGDQHYTYTNEISGEFLKETLLNKMEKAGLAPDETLNIRFDINAVNKKIKLIDYKGIKNRVCQCPIIIEAKPETKLFAWNVGLGNSTGIGFGSICY